jgi:Tetratricopeptide repeat
VPDGLPSHVHDHAIAEQPGSRVVTPKPSNWISQLWQYEKVLGPDHPNIAMSLNSLALLYESQGRYADAEPVATSI